jgi:hypothetical protein
MHVCENGKNCASLEMGIYIIFGGGKEEMWFSDLPIDPCAIRIRSLRIDRI